MMNIFGDLAGIALSAFEVHGMTPEEIEAYQIQNLMSAQQAKAFPDQYWRLMSSWNPAPERPLDERFADFKIRLAAAMAKRAAA